MGGLTLLGLLLAAVAVEAGADVRQGESGFGQSPFPQARDARVYPALARALAGNLELKSVTEYLPGGKKRAWDARGRACQPTQSDWPNRVFGRPPIGKGRRYFAFEVDWNSTGRTGAGIELPRGNVAGPEVTEQGSGPSSDSFSQSEFTIEKTFPSAHRFANVRLALAIGPPDRVIQHSFPKSRPGKPAKGGSGWLRPSPSTYWVCQIGGKEMAPWWRATGFVWLKSGKAVELQGTTNSGDGPDLSYFAAAGNVPRDDPPVRMRVELRRMRQVIFRHIPLMPLTSKASDHQ